MSTEAVLDKCNFSQEGCGLNRPREWGVIPRECSSLPCRDIQDKTVGTLSQSISSQLQSLHGLQTHLAGIRDYLQKVSKAKLPINHQILYQLQDVFNLLPNLSIEEFSRSFAVKTNDQLLVVYVASLIRSVIALDNLIGNKLSISEAEKKEVEKKKEDQKSKKAEGEDSKGKGKEGEGKEAATEKDTKGTSPKK